MQTLTTSESDINFIFRNLSFYTDLGTGSINGNSTYMGISGSTTFEDLCKNFICKNGHYSGEIDIYTNKGGWNTYNIQILKDLCSLLSISGTAPVTCFEIRVVNRSAGRVFIRWYDENLTSIHMAYLDNWTLSGSIKAITLS